MLATETERYDLERVFRRVTFYRRRRDEQLVVAKTFAAGLNMEKGIQEANILASLATKEDHNHHIVRIIERVPADENFHIVQELLERTLEDFKGVSYVRKFTIRQIRVILRQVLMALSRMKEVGIVHTRVHMNNVMLVDHARQPFRVKLIGFGDALTGGQHFSNFIYRPCSVISAPEALLGCPCSSKTDMWSVGCMAAKMALGQRLFEAEDELEMAHCIFGTRGLPPAAMLDSGIKTKQLFDRVDCENGTDGWQLKPWRKNVVTANLKDLEAKNQLEPGSRRHKLAELEDRRCLGHLLNNLLAVDPEQRIDPDRALHHPFFTLQHLRDPAYKTYHNLSLQAYQDADVSVPQDLPPGSWDSFEDKHQRRRPSLRRRLRSVFARIFICGHRERPAAAPGEEGSFDGERLAASATGRAPQSIDRDEVNTGEVSVEPPQRRAGFLRRWIRRVWGRRSSAT